MCAGVVVFLCCAVVNVFTHFGDAFCSITTGARAEVINRTVVYGARVGECAHV